MRAPSMGGSLDARRAPWVQRAVLALWPIGVGCGRFNFNAKEGTDASTQDGADGADDASADASTLVMCPVAPTAPPSVTITGTTFRYTDFSNTWTPVPNASLKALTSVTGSTLGSTTSDSGGAYRLTIATSNVPPPVVLEISEGGGQYFTTLEILDLPLDADLTAPALTTNDVFSPADAPLWDDFAIQSIYQQIQLARDAAKGSLNIAVRDCNDAPVFGVTVELDPPSELLRYQAPNGTASSILTETGPPFGHALAFNSPAGPTRIIARKGGVVVADQVIEVRGGMSYTMAIVRAPGL